MLNIFQAFKQTKNQHQLDQEKLKFNKIAQKKNESRKLNTTQTTGVF